MTKTAPVLEMQTLPISELRPDPANPRRISDAELESLTRSIQEFGLVDPIIARQEDGTVIGGHQRLLAARKLGLEKIPVILLDVSEEKARLLNLALNRISGSWDEELLARLLSDLGQTPDLDLTLSGFEDDEIKRLLKTLEVREKRDRPESFDLEAALEEARREPRVKSGELWALGDHRLLCGDATKTDDVTRLMDGRKAAVCVTDPPYGVALGDHGGQQRGQRRRRLENDNLPPEEWQEFVRGFVGNIIAFTDGAIYCFMSSKELPIVARVFEDAGGHWSDYLIWDKGQFVLGRAPYQRAYEPCWFGWPEGAKPYWCGDRDQADVWKVPRPSASEAHPTMKPLALIERALENSSKRGDIVLDLFLGSGSTLIAAERTGRVCYGTELDAHYASIVVARWEAFSGERAERIEGQ
ncbi:MAG: DNA methyltransferase [Thermoleophilia bacterium]|nr:DNA methyltransferase [Thermoleophilia bacterium]